MQAKQEFQEITDKIFLVRHFLSSKECDDFVNMSEQRGYEKAKVNTERGAQVLDSVRNNERLLYRDVSLAENIWQKAKPYIPSAFGECKAIGLNELFRFYKYEVGHRFKGHIDGSYRRNAMELSFFTFMVYLNDDFEGGETNFREHSIKPEKGMLLIFLHQLFHEGAAVTQGIKYVLRTDVMYRFDDKK
ncbi:MAG: 2OG-Fe(II) oxygenase [Bacteroidota bacterium]